MPTSNDVLAATTGTITMNPDPLRATTVTVTVVANTGDFTAYTPLGTKDYSVTAGVPLVIKIPTRGAPIDVENTGSETLSVSRNF